MENELDFLKILLSEAKEDLDNNDNNEDEEKPIEKDSVDNSDEENGNDDDSENDEIEDEEESNSDGNNKNTNEKYDSNLDDSDADGNNLTTENPSYEDALKKYFVFKRLINVKYLLKRLAVSIDTNDDLQGSADTFNSLAIKCDEIINLFDLVETDSVEKEIKNFYKVIKRNIEKLRNYNIDKEVEDEIEKSEEDRIEIKDEKKPLNDAQSIAEKSTKKVSYSDKDVLDSIKKNTTVEMIKLREEVLLTEDYIDLNLFNHTYYIDDDKKKSALLIENFKSAINDLPTIPLISKKIISYLIEKDILQLMIMEKNLFHKLWIKFIDFISPFSSMYIHGFYQITTNKIYINIINENNIKDKDFLADLAKIVVHEFIHYCEHKEYENFKKIFQEDILKFYTYFILAYIYEITNNNELLYNKIYKQLELDSDNIIKYGLSKIKLKEFIKNINYPLSILSLSRIESLKTNIDYAKKRLFLSIDKRVLYYLSNSYLKTFRNTQSIPAAFCGQELIYSGEIIALQYSFMDNKNYLNKLDTLMNK